MGRAANQGDIARRNPPAVLFQIAALLSEGTRRVGVAGAAHERAERLLYALPRDERPEEFDDNPS